MKSFAVLIGQLRVVNLSWFGENANTIIFRQGVCLSFSHGSVIAWCRENMANYKAPRRVEIVDELPTNASGKVLKYELRERAAESA